MIKWLKKRKIRSKKNFDLHKRGVAAFFMIWLKPTAKSENDESRNFCERPQPAPASRKFMFF